MRAKTASRFTLSFAALCLILLSPPARADSTAAGYEERAMNAFLLDCLPALAMGDSVEHIAAMKKLPELAGIDEAAYLRGQPGKVYALPDVGKGIVLTAPQTPMCSIMVQKLNPREFLHQADTWLDPQHSPFRLMANTTEPNGDVSRQYAASIGDTHIFLVMKVRPRPVTGDVQALVVAGRSIMSASPAP